MGNNVRQSMKISECPKPALGEVKGWAVGGATDMVLCADLLSMASDAHIGYAATTADGTVFGRRPGSAEMPSARRPFTELTVVDPVAARVGPAPLTLHTGVSSLESHETPYPERFEVPAATAWLVNDTRRVGGRVIATGTTVVRALESVVDDRRDVHPGAGWTDVIVTPERGAPSVDGLLTGWHEPEASHLQMLATIAAPGALQAAYDAAVETR